MMHTLRKALHWQGVYYQDFKRAIEWVEQQRICFDDLLGEVYPLSEWQQAFNASEM